MPNILTSVGPTHLTACIREQSKPRITLAVPAQYMGNRYPKGVRRLVRNREILSAFLLVAVGALGYI